MAKSKDAAKVGAWSFVVGLAIAVILGLLPTALSPVNTILLLGIIGIIVGLLNVTDRGLMLYLVANIAFLAAASSLLAVILAVPAVGTYLAGIVSNIAMFVAPGAAVVSLKALYDVSKD